jgi:hypothetical protein
MPRTIARRGVPTEPQSAPLKPGNTQDGVPTPPMALPHERDEANDQTRPRTDAVMKRAHDDLAEGQVDTDMRATPGLDAARRKQLVPTPR